MKHLLAESRIALLQVFFVFSGWFLVRICHKLVRPFEVEIGYPISWDNSFFVHWGLTLLCVPVIWAVLTGIPIAHPLVATLQRRLGHKVGIGIALMLGTMFFLAALRVMAVFLHPL